MKTVILRLVNLRDSTLSIIFVKTKKKFFITNFVFLDKICSLLKNMGLKSQNSLIIIVLYIKEAPIENLSFCLNYFN